MAVTVTISIKGTASNGDEVNETKSFTKATVPRIFKDTVNCGNASEVNLLNIGTVEAATFAAFDTAFFFNEDAEGADTVDINKIKSGAETAVVPIAPQRFAIMNTKKLFAHATGGTGALVDATAITGKAQANNADIRVIAF